MQDLFDKEDKATEKLVPILSYADKAQSPPCSSSRYYINPVNGNSFICPPQSGVVIRFEIPAGSIGSHLHCAETCLSLTLQNVSGASLTFEGSAYSLIERVEVYYGSQQISSIAGYGNFATILQDFTGGTGTHFLKGQETATTGRILAASATDTFVLPLINCIGSLALKCIPLSELRDNIRVEIHMCPCLDFGVWSVTPGTVGPTITDAKLWLTNIQLQGDVHSALVASVNGRLKVPCFDVENYKTSIVSNVGQFNHTIPVKVSSLTMVIVSLREAGQLNVFGGRPMQRTRSTLSSYQFRIGSYAVPSALVRCDGTAAEARMELCRAMNNLNIPTAESYVSTTNYSAGTATSLNNVVGSFCFALNLSAMGAAEILSDGKNVRLENLSVEMKFSGGNVALIADFYCLHEKLLCIENSQLTYKN